jgi:hypothetical protein
MTIIESTAFFVGQVLTEVSDMVSGWTIANAVFNGIMALATALAAVFAIMAWRASKASQWREVINTYFREYREPEMGRAVADLYRYYERHGRDIEELVLAYVDEYRNLTDFHFDTRRRVSGFFQELAMLSRRNRQLRKIMYSVWTKGDLSIIPNILLPIEAIAARLASRIGAMSAVEINKYILDRTREGKIMYSELWAPVFKEMYHFWEKAKN